MADLEDEQTDPETGLPDDIRDAGVTSSRGGRRSNLAARALTQLTDFVSSDRAGPTFVIALAMTIMSWPVTNIVPQAGTDPSWQAGLAMAFYHGIQWGPRIDFTYGPLGFLTVPTLYFGRTAFLSLTYLLLSRWLLFTLLLWAARPKFPRYWAILVAYVVGGTVVFIVDSGDVLMGCTLLIGSLVIQSTSEPIVNWATPTLGVLTTIGFLLKFSVGLLALGVVVLAVASRRNWPRQIFLGASAFLLSLIVLWVVTGNSLSNIPLYFRLSSYVAEGYSGAMSEETGRNDEWYYAATLVVCLFFCLALSLGANAKRTKLCAILLFAWYSWITLKEGFVRHDGHDVIFFGLMMVAFVAMPWPRHKSAAPVGGALGLAMVLGWTAAGGVSGNLVTIASNIRSLASALHTVIDPADRAAFITTARNTLQAAYGLPAPLIDELNGQTAAIEPCEITVAWAYDGIKWDPEPILQQYTAYEAGLDHEEASFLLSSSAPRYILNLPPTECSTSDPFFQAPTASVTTLCRYEQAGASSDWQLLVRVANRCGPLVKIKTFNAKFGSTVTVPTAPPNDAVVATFEGVGSSLIYRLENLLLKAPAIEMQIPGADYRFIAGTAGDLHVLRAPSTLGYAASFSPPPVSSFSITKHDLFSNSGSYRVTFYELSVGSTSMG